MRHGRLLALLLTLATLASGCTGDPSRREVLSELAANDIVPMYERLEASASVLAATTTELCSSGGPAALADTHAALAHTRAAWSETEAAWIGPVMDRRSWAVIDWPISSQEIEDLIADESVALDVDRIGKAIGADQRGLGALEHMLGEPGASVDASQRFNARRCSYMVGVADVIHTEAELLLGDWTIGDQERAPYVDQLATDGTTALDSLINDTLFLLEDIGDRELGAALGVMGGEADLDSIVEGPAGQATADIAAHLAGLRTVLVGDGASTGVRSLVGEDISRRLTEQFDAAQSAVASIGSPLRTSIETQRTEVEALRDAVKTIQVTVATEVVSRLGVTIGFSDADGDTGA